MDATLIDLNQYLPSHLKLSEHAQVQILARPKERQCLELALQGLSTKEIAAKLIVTNVCVERNLCAAYRLAPHLKLIVRQMRYMVRREKNAWIKVLCLIGRNPKGD